MYLFIILLKTTENTLSTIRIITLSNGKKLISAILNVIVAIIWIYSASIVIKSIEKDFGKVISFSIGTFIGSYLGSYIEEKINKKD